MTEDKGIYRVQRHPEAVPGMNDELAHMAYRLAMYERLVPELDLQRRMLLVLMRQQGVGAFHVTEEEMRQTTATDLMMTEHPEGGAVVSDGEHRPSHRGCVRSRQGDRG